MEKKLDITADSDLASDAGSVEALGADAFVDAAKAADIADLSADGTKASDDEAAEAAYAASMVQDSSSSSSMGAGVVFVLFAVALVVALWVVSGVAGSQTREQGAITLRQTVMDTAMQCFAIEGAYPPSLKYLEDNYGLSVNDEDYSIRYEVFASNVMPSVVVMPK